ncbi:YkyA family protein [Ectobacillus ponti]|uniref:YkyA family protein n=1 Tax=Ectobacillus ponti TaxID=2961894 RepID=A0AA41X7E8_9BACI|nr:YkyA family protein [Ectobacillus ponti]MCP8970311.1 YkyA family protein [Ectobacillus ponti]
MHRYMCGWLAAALLLSGCSERNTVNDMYEGLEGVARLEQRFEQEQEPLVMLERKEKDLYRQIMSLGIEERQKRRDLAVRAEQTLQEREQHLSEEQHSLERARARFQKIALSASRLRNKSLRKQGRELLQLMDKRYQTYDELHRQYETALAQDKELYRLLQGDGVSFLPVQQQVKRINEEYKRVQQLNEAFNQWTDQYNTRKQAFYRKSGLRIVVAE